MDDEIPELPMAEEPDTQFHSARKPLTDHEIELIDRALEKAQGHRALAAKILKMDEKRLFNAVRNVAKLQAKWGHKSTKAVDDSIAGEIERDPPISPISKTQEKAALALTNQDLALRRGWDKMGMSVDEKNFLANLQDSYAMNGAGVIALTGAGVAHTYTRLLFTFKRLEDDIRDVDQNPEKYRRVSEGKFGVNEVKGPHEYRMELIDRLLKTEDAMRKVTKDVQELALVRARIEKLRVEQAQDTRKKQGWSGPAVDVPTHVETVKPS